MVRLALELRTVMSVMTESKTCIGYTRTFEELCVSLQKVSDGRQNDI